MKGPLQVTGVWDQSQLARDCETSSRTRDICDTYILQRWTTLPISTNTRPGLIPQPQVTVNHFASHPRLFAMTFPMQTLVVGNPFAGANYDNYAGFQSDDSLQARTDSPNRQSRRSSIAGTLSDTITSMFDFIKDFLGLG